jgi:hypothetical protein
VFLFGLLLFSFSLYNWRHRKPEPHSDLKYGSTPEQFAPLLTVLGGSVVIVLLLTWLNQF